MRTMALSRKKTTKLVLRIAERIFSVTNFSTYSVLSMSRSELEPCLAGDWERGRFAGCVVALALLFAVVTQGDAYLFHRLGGFSGGGRSSLSSPCPLVL